MQNFRQVNLRFFMQNVIIHPRGIAVFFSVITSITAGFPADFQIFAQSRDKEINVYLNKERNITSASLHNSCAQNVASNV